MANPTNLAGVLAVAVWLGYGLLSTPVVAGLLAVAAVPAVAIAAVWGVVYCVSGACGTRGRWTGHVRVPGTRFDVELAVTAR